MSDRRILVSDLSLPMGSVWALRVAKIPYYRDYAPGTHYFLELGVDKGAKNNAFTLDELHFKEIYCKDEGDTARRKEPASENWSTSLLRAVAYKISNGRLEKPDTLVITSGPPAQVMNVWNSFFHVALEVNGLNLPFNRRNNCRTAVKTALESVGYDVQQVEPLRRFLGSEGKLDATISLHPPLTEVPDAGSLIKDFRILHRKLETPRA